MPCFNPIPAWRCQDGLIVFSEPATRAHGGPVRNFDIACGQCLGCRLEYSRKWAVRCMHESQMHDVNSYVTLTYDDDHLPAWGNLVYRHFQLFMKRLRKYFSGKKIRFFMCGEYGDQTRRPHFHACLFGVSFDDAVFYTSRKGKDLYTSALLDSIWGNGGCTVGQVEFESAAYVAGYIMKKVNGDLAEKHYRVFDHETGEVFQLTPEFCKMSLRPGIGSTWFDKYRSDCFPSDFVISRGMRVGIPKYYDVLHDRYDGIAADDVKYKRELDNRDKWRDNTPERLEAKREVAKARMSRYKRDLE